MFQSAGVKLREEQLQKKPVFIVADDKTLQAVRFFIFPFNKSTLMNEKETFDAALMSGIKMEDMVIMHKLDKHIIFRSKELYILYVRKFKDIEPCTMLDESRRWIQKNCPEIKKFLSEQSCKRCGTLAKKHCSKCGMNKYCSVKCQKEDWVNHKLICGKKLNKNFVK